MSRNLLSVSLLGLYRGSRNDAGMLISSKLQELTAGNGNFSPPGKPDFILYGDPAHKPSAHVKSPFNGGVTNLEAKCNI